MSDSGASRARSRFQSGLLAWLRAPDDPAGLREMIAVLRDLTAAETQASGRVLWRSAETVLATILDQTLPVDDEVLQICRRIERHLTAHAKGKAPDDAELRDALFGFASRRRPVPGIGANPLPPPELGPVIGPALINAAELLPLMLNGAGPKYPENKVAAWSAGGDRLERAWHALFGGTGETATGEFRAAATMLVAAALDLGDPACLRLAEALASAGTVADERTAREQPALRAAVAAALEVVRERDGPNHKHFNQRAVGTAIRLEGALADSSRSTASGSADHELEVFLSEARDVVEELRHALVALPPDLVALRQGALWFAQHGGPANTIALRGLATLLGDALAQARHEEIDGPTGQRQIGAAVDALSAALDQIAAGQRPVADEAAFAGLRELAARKPKTGLRWSN